MNFNFKTFFCCLCYLSSVCMWKYMFKWPSDRKFSVAEVEHIYGCCNGIYKNINNEKQEKKGNVHTWIMQNGEKMNAWPIKKLHHLFCALVVHTLALPKYVGQLNYSTAYNVVQYFCCVVAISRTQHWPTNECLNYLDTWWQCQELKYSEQQLFMWVKPFRLC